MRVEPVFKETSSVHRDTSKDALKSSQELTAGSWA